MSNDNYNPENLIRGFGSQIYLDIWRHPELDSGSSLLNNAPQPNSSPATSPLLDPRSAILIDGQLYACLISSQQPTVVVLTREDTVREVPLDEFISLGGSMIHREEEDEAEGINSVNGALKHYFDHKKYTPRDGDYYETIFRGSQFFQSLFLDELQGTLDHMKGGWESYNIRGHTT